MNEDFAVNTPIQTSLPEVDTRLPYYLTNYGRQYWVSPEDRVIMRLNTGYDNPLSTIVDFSHERGIFIVYLLGGKDGVPESRETWEWGDTIVQQAPYQVHYHPDNLRYWVNPMDRQVTLQQGPGVPEERAWNFIPWIDGDGELHLRARDQVLLGRDAYSIRTIE